MLGAKRFKSDGGMYWLDGVDSDEAPGAGAAVAGAVATDGGEGFGVGPAMKTGMGGEVTGGGRDGAATAIGGDAVVLGIPSSNEAAEMN